MLPVGQSAEYALASCKRGHHLMFIILCSTETLRMLMVRLPSLLHVLLHSTKHILHLTRMRRVAEPRRRRLAEPRWRRPGPWLLPPAPRDPIHGSEASASTLGVGIRRLREAGIGEPELRLGGGGGGGPREASAVNLRRVWEQRPDGGDGGVHEEVVLLGEGLDGGLLLVRARGRVLEETEEEATVEGRGSRRRRRKVGGGRWTRCAAAAAAA